MVLSIKNSSPSLEAIEELRSQLNVSISDRKYLRKRVREQTTKLRKTKRLVKDTTKAQHILQELAASVQERTYKHLNQIVSRCLEAVFEEPYEFQIIFEKKRGRTEARLTFVRDGAEIDPREAAGGGVVDVAAFALRLAALLLKRPKVRRLLVLDEPFKMVDASCYSKLVELLNALAKELKVQFLVVTHIEALQIGKVIDLREIM